MLCKTEWSWESRTWSHKINSLDILSTSPHYFCRKWIRQQKRIQILILVLKELILIRACTSTHPSKRTSTNLCLCHYSRIFNYHFNTSAWVEEKFNSPTKKTKLIILTAAVCQLSQHYERRHQALILQQFLHLSCHLGNLLSSIQQVCLDS